MPDTISKRELPLHADNPQPDASLDADTAGLHEVLHDLKRVYQFRDRDRICCYDISVTQSWALEALARRGPLTLNDLAGDLYLNKSTASRVVDALERKGYVERAQHPNDGRALSIRITRRGARLRDRIEHDILAQERRLLSEFEPAVRRSMVQLIGRLAEAASAGLVSRGGKCCSIDSLEG
jgi:MarR family 2-MHQ and catechol resistance regulon transcriptional repressor